jgi:hypothetical protein
MIIGRVQRRESVRQRGRLPLMVLGRVKTPTFNLGLEISFRFRQFEIQKRLRPLFWDKTTEKTILRIFALVHVFTLTRVNRDRMKRRFRFYTTGTERFFSRSGPH